VNNKPPGVLNPLVDSRDGRNRESVQRIPGFGEEPSHRGENDDGSGVVSHVCGVEPRPGRRLLTEGLPQAVRLCFGQDFRGDCRLQIIPGDVQRALARHGRQRIWRLLGSKGLRID
jgi:hypothetical protein